MNYDALIAYIAVLWLLCLVAVIADAKSKKPGRRANGVQATRNTQLR